MNTKSPGKNDTDLSEKRLRQISANRILISSDEIEFGSKRDAKKFEAPERFGEELTRMREATNGYIANHGLSDELVELMK